MKKTIITTDKLNVGYERNVLIKDINLEIREGEIVSLIGQNGAGKTTILKSIIAQLEPIDGFVYIDDNDVYKMDRKNLSKEMSVVLTGKPDTELMTARDVVATGRYPYTGRFGLLSDRDNELIDEAMTLTDVYNIGNKDFSRISDGQKQRVMLAKAICQEPRIIILDEPTSYLDVKYKIEFMTILQKMAREKKIAVLMSLHELDLAEKVSDTVVCIKGDSVDLIGQPKEVFNKKYIEDLYEIKLGSYLDKVGSIELESVKGQPKVFVLAGNGTGTFLYRELQRQGIPFATGILYENDIDYIVARSLTNTVISAKMCDQISEDKIEQAKEVMLKCEKVICTLNFNEIGQFCEPLKLLFDFAMDKKLI